MLSLNEILSLWNYIFFNPQYATVLGLFRILIGLLCIAKTFVLWKHASDYLGPEGWYNYKSWKSRTSGDLYFSFFNCLPPSMNSVYLILSAFLFSSICLCIGYHTEISAIFTYLFWVSINHRNVHIFNSGDSLLRIILFLLIFSGSGNGLSLDNHILGKSQFYTMVNPWVWRLMQITLINVYFQSVYEKINNGSDWRTGVAFYYALSNESYARFRITKYINKYTSLIFSWGTLAVELFSSLGLLFKETNGICIVILLILHSIFEIMLKIGMFGFLMMFCVLLFLDPVWTANLANFISIYLENNIFSNIYNFI
jgi:hypothetical protein